MTGTILTNDVIAEKALPHFMNNCKAIRCCNRDYEREYQREEEGYNIGETVRIRKPSYYNVTEGEIAQPQAINEFSDSLTLNYQLNVAFDPSNTKLTTDMREAKMYEERVIMPAAIGLGNVVDTKVIYEMDTAIYRGLSSLGVGVNSFASFKKASALLYKYAVAKPYFAIMNVDDSTNLQNSLQNAFNTTLNEEISIDGLLGYLAAVETYEDQNMTVHQNGTNNGTPLVKGAGQTGSSLLTDGWTAGETVLKAGDLITLANVYGVNPVPPNQQIGTGSANYVTFRVTADVLADGSGNATIPIFPAITPTTVYKTVSNVPADNAVITVLGNTQASNVYSQNFMFSKSFATLAIVPLRRPEGAVKMGMYTDENTGISIRVIDGYDVITNKEVKRMDVLFGIKAFGQYGLKF